MADGKVVLFSPNEGIVFSDFNELVAGATQRAWEWPGYATMMQASALGISAYGVQFHLGTELSAPAFTIGGGLEPVLDSFTSKLKAGFIGAYQGLLAPEVLVPKMRWAYVLDDDFTYEHPANADTDPTHARWDLAVVEVAEVDGDSTTRDFKDSTTGVRTTTTTNKHKLLQATISVVTGTPGGGIPPRGTGKHLLYAVNVPPSSATPTEIRDFTFPFAPVRAVGSYPSDAARLPATWAVVIGGGLRCIDTSSVKYAVFPAPCFGDSTARIIGLHLKYRLGVGATVEVGGFGFSAPPAADVDDNSTFISAFGPTADDISSALTLDGTDQQTMIDLRGEPSSNFGPFWGHGERAKTASGPYAHRGVALRVQANAVDDAIIGLKWIYAAG